MGLGPIIKEAIGLKEDAFGTRTGSPYTPVVSKTLPNNGWLEGRLGSASIAEPERKAIHTTEPVKRMIEPSTPTLTFQGDVCGAFRRSASLGSERLIDFQGMPAVVAAS